MKGIVLAAGKGTRLYPMTKPVCKPLLPVYDKPLIYYPIAILMQAGISDIMVIVPPWRDRHLPGSAWGTAAPMGCRSPTRNSPWPGALPTLCSSAGSLWGTTGCAWCWGTTSSTPPSLGATLKQAAAFDRGATVFGYWVEDPHPFGVVEFDENGRAISIEEKPRHPKSNYVIPGLYFYDNQVMEIAGNLKPSARGELEITDVNLEYLRRGQLQVIPLEKGFTWLDAGTADSLLTAGQTIKEIQDETGRYVGCLEELGLQEGWITADHVHKIGDELSMTLYGKYLQCL